MLTSKSALFLTSCLNNSSWNSALAPWPEAYAEMRVSEYHSAARR